MKQEPYLDGLAVLVVGSESGRESCRRISACEQCSKQAVTPFERVLDDVLIGQGAATSYLLGTALVCPNCEGPITEMTLVQLKEPYDAASSAVTFEWFDLPLPETNVVLVDEATIVEAQSLMTACGHCEDNAQITFDYLLDSVTRCDPAETEYLMCRPARCPGCFREITEKTLVVS